MLKQNSGVSFPHQKTRKNVDTNMSRQTLCLQGRAKQHVDLNPLDFYLWGHLKPPSVFSSN
jgi:hypothetical protein